MELGELAQPGGAFLKADQFVEQAGRGAVVAHLLGHIVVAEVAGFRLEVLEQLARLDLQALPLVHVVALLGIEGASSARRAGRAARQGDLQRLVVGTFGVGQVRGVCGQLQKRDDALRFFSRNNGIEEIGHGVVLLGGQFLTVLKE